MLSRLLDLHDILLTLDGADPGGRTVVVDASQLGLLATQGDKSAGTIRDDLVADIHVNEFALDLALNVAETGRNRLVLTLFALEPVDFVQQLLELLRRD